MPGLSFSHLLAFVARERQRQARAPLDTVLRTPRLILRAADVSDEHSWLALRRLSARELVPAEPKWPKGALTHVFYQGQWRRWCRRWVQDREYSLLIFVHENKEVPPALVGGISISDVRRNVLQAGTLGYWMGSYYTGKGYMREAITAALDFAFGTLQLHRLEASCLPDNARSLSLLQGAGFREIGLSKNYMQIDGIWRDHLLFEKEGPQP